MKDMIVERILDHSSVTALANDLRNWRNCDEWLCFVQTPYPLAEGLGGADLTSSRTPPTIENVQCVSHPWRLIRSAQYSKPRRGDIEIILTIDDTNSVGIHPWTSCGHGTIMDADQIESPSANRVLECRLDPGRGLSAVRCAAFSKHHRGIGPTGHRPFVEELGFIAVVKPSEFRNYRAGADDETLKGLIAAGQLCSAEDLVDVLRPYFSGLEPLPGAPVELDPDRATPASRRRFHFFGEDGQRGRPWQLLRAHADGKLINLTLRAVGADPRREIEITELEMRFDDGLLRHERTLQGTAFSPSGRNKPLITSVTAGQLIAPEPAESGDHAAVVNEMAKEQSDEPEDHIVTVAAGVDEIARAKARQMAELLAAGWRVQRILDHSSVPALIRDLRKCESEHCWLGFVKAPTSYHYPTTESALIAVTPWRGGRIHDPANDSEASFTVIDGDGKLHVCDLSDYAESCALSSDGRSTGFLNREFMAVLTKEDGEQTVSPNMLLNHASPETLVEDIIAASNQCPSSPFASNQFCFVSDSGKDGKPWRTLNVEEEAGASAVVLRLVTAMDQIIKVRLTVSNGKLWFWLVENSPGTGAHVCCGTSAQEGVTRDDLIRHLGIDDYKTPLGAVVGRIKHLSPGNIDHSSAGALMTSLVDNISAEFCFVDDDGDEGLPWRISSISRGIRTAQFAGEILTVQFADPPRVKVKIMVAPSGKLWLWDDESLQACRKELGISSPYLGRIKQLPGAKEVTKIDLTKEDTGDEDNTLSAAETGLRLINFKWAARVKGHYETEWNVQRILDHDSIEALYRDCLSAAESGYWLAFVSPSNVHGAITDTPWRISAGDGNTPYTFRSSSRTPTGMLVAIDKYSTDAPDPAPSNHFFLGKGEEGYGVYSDVFLGFVAAVVKRDNEEGHGSTEHLAAVIDDTGDTPDKLSILDHSSPKALVESMSSLWYSPPSKAYDFCVPPDNRRFCFVSANGKEGPTWRILGIGVVEDTTPKSDNQVALQLLTDQGKTIHVQLIVGDGGNKGDGKLWYWCGNHTPDAFLNSNAYMVEPVSGGTTRLTRGVSRDDLSPLLSGDDRSSIVGRIKYMGRGGPVDHSSAEAFLDNLDQGERYCFTNPDTGEDGPPWRLVSAVNANNDRWDFKGKVLRLRLLPDRDTPVETVEVKLLVTDSKLWRWDNYASVQLDDLVVSPRPGLGRVKRLGKGSTNPAPTLEGPKVTKKTPIEELAEVVRDRKYSRDCENCGRWSVDNLCPRCAPDNAKNTPSNKRGGAAGGYIERKACTICAILHEETGDLCRICGGPMAIASALKSGKTRKGFTPRVRKQPWPRWVKVLALLAVMAVAYNANCIIEYAAEWQAGPHARALIRRAATWEWVQSSWNSGAPPKTPATAEYMFTVDVGALMRERIMADQESQSFENRTAHKCEVCGDVHIGAATTRFERGCSRGLW